PLRAALEVVGGHHAGPVFVRRPAREKALEARELAADPDRARPRAGAITGPGHARHQGAVGADQVDAAARLARLAARKRRNGQDAQHLALRVAGQRHRLAEALASAAAKARPDDFGLA